MQNHIPPSSILSRRSFLRRIGQLTTATVLIQSAIGAATAGPAIAAPVPQPTPPDVPPDIAPPQAGSVGPAQTIEGVSLADKIGQMIMVGFGSPSVAPTSRIVEHIGQRNLGGVALFSPNIESFEQVDTLVHQLQAAANVPLLVAIDQEGGYVRRLGNGFGLTLNYTPQDLGTINDLELTRQFATEMAQLLAALGINLNLAPVVDLNTNPQNPVIGRIGRSFSADANVVVQHALTFIQAHHEAGVLCTLKHFPGHGSSAQDSHLGFVDVTHSWTPQELEPYAQIIGAGRCDAVMTAHIFNAALDAELPATLSKAVLTDILRRQMGYDGIIITDDIQMAAIRSFYSFETAIELAVNAGVDVFASSTYSPSVVENTIDLIQRLVETGKINESRIDASYRRVMAMKARLGGPHQGGPRIDRDKVQNTAPAPNMASPATPETTQPDASAPAQNGEAQPEDLIKYLH